jgi:hypothetical protein
VISSRILPTASVVLCALLAVPPRAMRADQAEAPTQLNIVIVEGEGAVNNLRQRVVREPIVRVEDQNHKPVAGAAVTFLLPGNGAGGTFVNGAKLLVVTSDANGQAVARGIKTNKLSGQYQIQVTASLGSVSATAVISQVNAPGAAGGAAGTALSTKIIVILAIAGAAAATGTVLALTHGGSTPTALSPGAATVVAPH